MEKELLANVATGSEEYERPVKETLRCLGWAATLDDGE